MNPYSPHYLDRLNEVPENVARFIHRLPEIQISTDRNTTINALTPTHIQVIVDAGIDPQLLRRAEQMHGKKVALVGDIGCSIPVEGIDGLISSGNADCCLAIYVADCAAIWIYDQVKGTRALLHSGKVGTENNIVKVALKAMYKFEESKAEDCIAVISPCIRPPHFEMDIPQTIKQQLLDAGVKEENIIDCGIDTYSNLDSYYSYRREKGRTGRMLALFGRLPHEASAH